MISSSNTSSTFNYLNYGKNSCFLCGKNDPGNITDEHVFPKWLLHKYNLWDKSLFLLNSTSIQYRHLTIPCCKQCNNYFLSKLESVISNALDNGFDSVMNLDETYIFQWLGKIFFGLLYKEVSLLSDRSAPENGTILEEDYLHAYNLLHTLLQSIRLPVNFGQYQPWSLFIIKAKGAGTKWDFTYHDYVEKICCSIRLGDIGIIMCFGDNGVIKKLQHNYYNQFLLKHRLNPIQFDQLCAYFFYQKATLNFTPDYIIIGDDKKFELVSLNYPDVLSDNIFIQSDIHLLANCYHKYMHQWGFSPDDIFQEPNLLIDQIHKADGSFRDYDI